MPVIKTREETVEATEAIESAEVGEDGVESNDKYLNLAQVLCIWYPVIFQKKSVSMSVLFDSGSEVNAIYPTLAQKLGLPVRLIDIEAQKIDGIMLDTFGMVVTAFSVMDKANRIKFFEEIFLIANVSPEIVLRILFLTLSSADVNFLS